MHPNIHSYFSWYFLPIFFSEQSQKTSEKTTSLKTVNKKPGKEKPEYELQEIKHSVSSFQKKSQNEFSKKKLW